jgi:hypothetical protein
VIWTVFQEGLLLVVSKDILGSYWELLLLHLGCLHEVVLEILCSHWELFPWWENLKLVLMEEDKPNFWYLRKRN